MGNGCCFQVKKDAYIMYRLEDSDKQVIRESDQTDKRNEWTLFVANNNNNVI